MPLNPYDISSIYADMELDLITSMKQNLTRHRKEELKEGFKWEQWQKAKLKDIRRFQKQNKKVIADYQAVIDSQTSDLLKESYRQGKKNSNSFIKRMMDKVKEKFEPKEKRFFVNNDDKVKALMKTVKGDLHNANYAALRQMDDVYRKTLFKAQMYYSNGAVSLEKAIDMATKDFLNKGIDCITYKNGRKVNIASYAEMAVRTSNQRAMLMGEGTKRAEYGIHTVCSSIHSNTCPLCLLWQGRVLIDDVYSGGTKEDGDYPLLSTAMEDGFLHANCRHHPTTFFPDINKEPKELTEDEQQEALEKYNAEQKQRRIERDIKKWKRVEAGSVDPDNLAVAHTRVEQLQAQMKQHLQDNPYLRREPWREKLREGLQKPNYNNGLGINDYIFIPESTVAHADFGDYTNPKNPKKIKPKEIRLKKGGHGQKGMDELDRLDIDYDMVKEYTNGVRIGNLPNHLEKIKRTGTKQAWFPKSWSDEDISKAAEYVANLSDIDKYVITKNYDKDGKLISKFKYANYKDVTVGVCFDVKKQKITTIFPDETQRMLGGVKNG